MPTPQVLFFDVFGTCVDWRTTITAQLHAECRLVWDNPKATQGMSDLDKKKYESMTPARWGQFAQAWRDSYMGFCSYQSKTPSHPFITVDRHHRKSLRALLGEWGLADLWPADEDIVRISDHWHRLDGWLDTTEGLERLHQLCATVTLTNGNKTLVSDLRRHAKMTFDKLLCAEDFEAYKPSDAVYDGGVRLMKVHAQQCMMVAAHLGDLRAANSRGMQTAYIERDGEEKASPQEVEEARKKWLDYYIPLEKGNPEGGLVMLAAELEARGATSRDPIIVNEEVEGVTSIPKGGNY